MNTSEKKEKLFAILQEKDMPAFPLAAKEAGVSYTDYMTGAHKKGPFNYSEGGEDYVYTPDRNRQCAIGWHGECSDPEGESCGCVCHDIIKLL